MPNRSLEDHLFIKALPNLPWIIRLNIMLGVAQGLAYLHDGLEVKVINYRYVFLFKLVELATTFFNDLTS